MTQLLQETQLDDKELKSLVDIFRRALPEDSLDYTVPLEVLRDLPETATMPLFQRALQMHNAEHDNQIRFQEFARAFSDFSPRATLEEKLQFAFRIFDINGSGRIVDTEMFTVLRMCIGTCMPDAALMEIIRKYLQGFPDGLGFEDFCKVMDVHDLNKLCFGGYR